MEQGCFYYFGGGLWGGGGGENKLVPVYSFIF